MHKQWKPARDKQKQENYCTLFQFVVQMPMKKHFKNCKNFYGSCYIAGTLLQDATLSFNGVRLHFGKYTARQFIMMFP